MDVKLIVSASVPMPGWAQVLSALGTVMGNNPCVHVGVGGLLFVTIGDLFL